jgi:hypothetical protein
MSKTPTPKTDALRKRKYANAGRALHGALHGAWEAHERLERELTRLKEVEHMAWHALEASEERDADVLIPREDAVALSRLLPEGHP